VDDAYEANDTIETAVGVSSGDVSAIAGPSNEDWFVVQLCQNAAAAVRVLHPVGEDVDVTLHDRDGTLLQEGVALALGERGFDHSAPLDGPVYVRVAAQATWSCFSYTFRVSVDESGCLVPNQCDWDVVSLRCGETLSGDNTGSAATQYWEQYPTCNVFEPGYQSSEVIYQFVADRDYGTVHAQLLNEVTQPLPEAMDLLVVEGCSTSNCLSIGESDVTVTSVYAGSVYYFVVDGFVGTTGTFDIRLTCTP